jgi:5'(3')-deoxyribonucleotidase
VNDLFGKGNEIHFVTSRAKESAILVTGRWLEEWGFMYSDVHFSTNEGNVDLYRELELDIFVDDNPSVVDEINKIGGMGVLMTQDYNVDDETAIRIDDLYDLHQLRL